MEVNMLPLQPSSHLTNPSFIQKLKDKTGISEQIALDILNYAKAHQEEWDKRLDKNQRGSLLLRHGKTGLPFTIEYWKSGELLVHTKKGVGIGGNKKVMLSADLVSQKLFARVKGSNKEKTLREAFLTDEFSGPGIVKKQKESHYKSKMKKGVKKEKFAMIQELYDGTFNQLLQRNLSPAEVELAVKDLSRGLASIHNKKYIHDDFKDANIFFKLNPETQELSELVIGDYGESTNEMLLWGEKVSPEEEMKLLDGWQTEEVMRLLIDVGALFSRNKLKEPESITALYNQAELWKCRNNKKRYDGLVKYLKEDNVTIPPLLPVSANDVVRALEEYYKK